MNEVIDRMMMNFLRKGIKKTGTPDKVYDFFVKSKPGVRKRAYKKALSAAQKDQLNIIKMASTYKNLVS